jgi:hypothetical protein
MSNAVDFIGAGTFHQYYDKFYNNKEVINFLRKGYFASNEFMTELDFKYRLDTDIIITNQNFEKEQIWFISCEPPSKLNLLFYSVSGIYVNENMRNQGIGSEVITILRELAMDKTMFLPLPFQFSVSEKRYTKELASFYEKNYCISMHKPELDDNRLKWYRFFTASFDFDLKYNEKIQRAEIVLFPEVTKKLQKILKK